MCQLACSTTETATGQRGSSLAEEQHCAMTLRPSHSQGTHQSGAVISSARAAGGALFEGSSAWRARRASAFSRLLLLLHEPCMAGLYVLRGAWAGLLVTYPPPPQRAPARPYATLSPCSGIMLSPTRVSRLLVLQTSNVIATTEGSQGHGGRTRSQRETRRSVRSCGPCAAVSQLLQMQVSSQ